MLTYVLWYFVTLLFGRIPPLFNRPFVSTAADPTGRLIQTDHVSSDFYDVLDAGAEEVLEDVMLRLHANLQTTEEVYGHFHRR